MTNGEACNLVARALDVPLEEIQSNSAIGNVRGWDSLGHVKIIIAVESALGRALRANEVAVLRSLNDIAALLGGRSEG